MRPRGRKQELQGDARQRELVVALVALLNDGRSFAELSVNDIAKRAGITRSAFYFYFTSKEQALLAASAEVIGLLQEAWQPFLQDLHADPRESLDITYSRVTRIRHSHGPLIRAFSESAATDPATWKFATAAVDRLSGLAVPRIMHVREHSGLPPLSQREAEELSRTLSWCNERNFYRAAVAKYDQDQWRIMVKTLTDLWLGAMGVDRRVKPQPTKRSPSRTKRR
jgi:AcrR family transcriptional regulator